MVGIQRLMRQHGYVAAALSVVLATLMFVPLRHYVDFAHLAWLYVCVVGLVAWLSGTGPALLAAALAFAAGTYFTPPVGAFRVSKPLDLIQLLIFFAGAAAVGTLTSQVRKRETAAIEREREATALARLASDMAQGSGIDSIVESAAACLSAQPDVRHVVIWVAEPQGLEAKGPGAGSVRTGERQAAARAFEHATTVGPDPPVGQAERLGLGGLVADQELIARGAGTFIPLVSSSATEGVLQLAAADSLSDSTLSLAVSISRLLALFIASERALESATRVQGAEEAARVKAVIVSAVSHELKTPLAAAVAGVTDLMSDDVPRDPEQVRRELSDVADDLVRLQTAIGDLLDLSRLQAEEWMPHPELYEAGEILGDVVAASSNLLRERLVFRVKARPVPEVYADFTQVARALRAVLDNAVSYSPADAPIFLGAERREERV